MWGKFSIVGRSIVVMLLAYDRVIVFRCCVYEVDFCLRNIAVLNELEYLYEEILKKLSYKKACKQTSFSEILTPSLFHHSLLCIRYQIVRTMTVHLMTARLTMVCLMTVRRTTVCLMTARRTTVCLMTARRTTVCLMTARLMTAHPMMSFDCMSQLLINSWSQQESEHAQGESEGIFQKLF